MSKFCPDIQCEFWEDFPDGLAGKKLKVCPCCSEELLTERPVQDSLKFYGQKERSPFSHSSEFPSFIPRDGDSAIQKDKSLPISHSPESTSSISLDGGSAIQEEKTQPDLHSPESLSSIPLDGDSANPKDKTLPISHSPESPSSIPRDGDSANQKDKSLPVSHSPELPSSIPLDGDSAIHKDKTLPISHSPESPSTIPRDGDSIIHKAKTLPVSHSPELPSSIPLDGDSAIHKEKTLPISHASESPSSIPRDGDLASQHLDGHLYSTGFPLTSVIETSRNVVRDETCRSRVNSITPVLVHSEKEPSLAEKRMWGEDDDLHNSQPNSGIRMSKIIEDKLSIQSQQDDKTIFRKLGICTEIDSSETYYVNIQFTTLILKEYWKKIDAICLRIGHKYFGEFKTSIVPFGKVNTIKLQCGKFVIISGTLKFPIKHIFKGEICFPYKYFIYSKDNNASYEDLHYFINNFNRFLIWNTVKHPIQPFGNAIYQQFDMMILPEIRKKEGMTFWSIMNSAISYVGLSGRSDRDIPFSLLLIED